MSNNYSQDIPYTQQSDAQEYVEAFNIEGESIDFNVLNEYKESNYTLNSANLQNVENAINVIQSNWQHDVIDGLDNKKNILQDWINNLASSAEEWEPLLEKNYYKNDIVTYSEDPGAYFICLEDCNGTEPINYIKFTNTFNNTDKFDWGLCVNGDVDDKNTSFIGESEFGSLPFFRLRYEYDGNYTLRFVKKDNFVGEIDYLIFKGSKEIFERMNYVVDDSKWLRIYLNGSVGLNSFNLTYKGEWTGNTKLMNITPLPKTIKMLDNAQNVCFKYTLLVEKDSYDFYIIDMITFEYGKREQIIKHNKHINIDIFLDYDGGSYFNVRDIIFDGIVLENLFSDLRKESPRGELMPFNIVYVPNDVIYIKNGANIDFYVCISEVVYDNNTISPDQDTTHWVKLFTKKLDSFVILDSMPNQAWFNDDTNPSVFGVKQFDGITIKVIDRIHSESASNPQYLKLYTVANNVVDSNDNNLNTLINNLISNTNI